MGQWGPTLVSGEGNAEIDSGNMQPVSDVIAELVTPGTRTRFVGSVTPRGVWHVGSYGLGFFSNSVGPQDPPVIFWTVFMHEEIEDVGPPPINIGTLYADSVWWRLAPLAEINLTVVW